MPRGIRVRGGEAWHGLGALGVALPTFQDLGRVLGVYGYPLKYAIRRARVGVFIFCAD
jgi:hypothetical protein